MNHTGDIHVCPENDWRKHQTESRECWCNPRLEDENGDPQYVGDNVPVIVIHNALDGRQ